MSETPALRTRARLSAHVIWDHLVRPPALRRGEVPWSAEAVTPQWLTETICGPHAGAAAEEVRVSGGSSGSSVRRRLTVTYNEAGVRAGLPTELFAKTTPTILTRLSSSMAAYKEARFFEQVRPKLAIEAPDYVFAAWDRISGRSIQIHEDLVATKQASFCRHDTTISHEQAQEIVDLLAGFHGAFYASPRLAEDLGWLPAYELFIRAGERDGIQAGHDMAMVDAADVIPENVLARKAEIWPLLQRGLEVHAEEPRTVLHSDVHLGNWYITGAGHMGLCDWALVIAGPWSRDLAYALSTCLSPTHRRGWERGLIARYLDRLEAHGGPHVALDEAWRLYRQQMFAALLMWTPTLRHPPTMPDMQPEAMSREMIRRITTAIDDLDCFDSYAEARGGQRNG